MAERGAGDLAETVGRMELNAFAEACGWDAERTVACLKETIEWKKKQNFANETEKKAKAQLVTGDECATVFELFDKASLPEQLLTKGKPKAKEPLTEADVAVNASSFFEKLSGSNFSAP
eukprot:jgi/Pico_ML_1/54354/g4714.t1